MNVLIHFEKKPLFFTRPEHVISCSDPAFVRSALHEAERLLDAGYYLAGFLSYEAGYCFEERLLEKKTYGFPLLMLGAYRRPPAPYCPQSGRSDRFSICGLKLNITRPQYSSDIARIRRFIASGDVYQITYCIKLRFRFRGSPLALYSELLRAQPVPYPAFIETGDFHILSLSPERFIKKTGAALLTEPMKGTWPRGEDRRSDARARRALAHDEKNRAENLMIVDLLRNDLGRIGRRIAVPRIFTVTKYRTLFQMTSTVTGRVPRHVPFHDIVASLFPSGSVTGAPKIRAIEIIRGLEKEERRIYTGAIGYIAPDRNMYFNIPIRTLLIRNGCGEMGIGGGIVWDSTPQGEWEEGLLKARFFTDLSRSS